MKKYFVLMCSIVVMFAMVIFWWVGVLPYDFGVDMARVPVTGG